MPVKNGFQNSALDVCLHCGGAIDALNVKAPMV